jgi:alpha-galactosidase
VMLTNGRIQLRLGIGAQGTPLIEDVIWVESGQRIFAAAPREDGLRAWAPDALIPREPPAEPTAWRVTEDDVFKRAELDRRLAGGMHITWVVELAQSGSLFRMFVRMTNKGDSAIPVDWFPCWNGRWTIAGGFQSVRWWKALTFEPVERPLAPEGEVRLRSRLHSSDPEHREDAVNPYWIVTGPKGRLYFGLAWCGGWEAALRRDADALSFDIRLPRDETELILAPGECITGPILSVTACPERDEMRGRADWMRQRAALAKRLYGGPDPAFPLTYNHWYSTGWKNPVTAAFLKPQAAAMDPYAFDAFIVDWGWYTDDPEWTPHPDRYAPGEFEDILRTARAKGAIAGIWTEPQKAKGQLLDLATSDYTNLLLRHVAALRQRYGIGWWKYDQRLFVEGSRSGVMKNVAAFQDAMIAVRKAQPDLRIENCESGGRMINEYTMLWSQSQWLRDGGGNGIDHARGINIPVALGALEFVFPWAGNQWSNRLDQMPQHDDELMRCYCRSAMAMTWGIVADLPKISDRQRRVILQEIEHYRRLNELKGDYLYQVWPPKPGADVAGVAYFAANARRAGVLLYRWDRDGAFEARVALSGLRDDLSYQTEDLDTGARVDVSGRDLRERGLKVPFAAGPFSAMLFIEPAP